MDTRNELRVGFNSNSVLNKCSHLLSSVLTSIVGDPVGELEGDDVGG